MQKIEISSKTIIFAVFVFLLLKFLWVIKDLIFSLFIAFIIMSALKPFVLWLTKKKLPRPVASIVIYILFLGFFFNIAVLIFPPLVGEFSLLVKNFPFILQNFSPSIDSLSLDLTQQLPSITKQFLGILTNIFSNTIFVITTLFFSFYLLMQEDLMEGILIKFFEESKTQEVAMIIDKAEKRMSLWFWSEITLMTIVGVLTYCGLSLIGVKYALALAVLAGVLEAVPNLGPVISAVPAVVIGFSQSYFLGFATLALYFIVQQLENNLIVPIVMKKAVGLNPIITLIALIVGGKLGGVIGILLAIPTTLFIETLLFEIFGKTSVNMR